MDRLTLDAAGASWPSWERQKKSPASSFICSPPLQVLVSRQTGQVEASTHMDGKGVNQALADCHSLFGKFLRLSNPRLSLLISERYTS